MSEALAEPIGKRQVVISGTGPGGDILLNTESDTYDIAAVALADRECIGVVNNETFGFFNLQDKMSEFIEKATHAAAFSRL